jgi:hypothetical protein
VQSGVVFGRGRAPLSPMAKSVQRIGKPRITTVGPTGARRWRGRRRIRDALPNGRSTAFAVGGRPRGPCRPSTGQPRSTTIGRRPAAIRENMRCGRAGMADAALVVRPQQVCNFTGHLPARRQFNASMAPIPSGVAPPLPEKTGPWTVWLLVTTVRRGWEVVKGETSYGRGFTRYWS